MVDHRSASVPEYGPTENPAPKPCLDYFSKINASKKIQNASNVLKHIRGKNVE